MKYFETIKCEDLEVFNLSYHKKRIQNTVGLNISLEEYIYPPSDKLLKCKVIYDDTGVIDISYDSYVPKKINNFKLVYDDDIIYNKKSINRIELDKLLEYKDDEDEIIIVKNGLLTDTSIANIAIYYENGWITPRLPLLEGTCRARLVDAAKIKEKDITVDMLKSSKKIATLNAMVDFNEIIDFTIKDEKYDYKSFTK